MPRCQLRHHSAPRLRGPRRLDNGAPRRPGRRRCQCLASALRGQIRDGKRPAEADGHPAAIRTRSPQPLGHKVQKDCFTSTGPRAGCGIHGQFWLQIETSSNTFQGTGVASRPAAAPALHASRSRRVTFIAPPLIDGIRDNPLPHCAAYDSSRSRSSSCLHEERSASATSNVPRCRGCTR